MDEKGIQLGVDDKTRVMVDRDQKAVQKIKQGNHDLVTIIECICADGTALRPSIVYQGTRRDLKWGADNPCDASISISPKGWTAQELGFLWLKKDFAPQTALHLANPTDYRLLILDGHNSHCTFNFSDFAEKHRIIVLCLPSHMTHALQPCDVGVFGPLAAKWKSRVSAMNRDHIDITKYNLPFHYAFARNQAMKTGTITSAFRRTGIWPVDEKAIPIEAFEPAKEYMTQAAQPIPAVLPALLVPVPTATTTSVQSSSQDSSTTSPSSTSFPVAAISRSSTPPCPSTRSEIALLDAHRTLYRLAMPSPLKGNPSRQALEAENKRLHDIAQAAGVMLEKSYTQMVLMDNENERLRKQLHAKKTKPRRTYMTGKARLMTSEEMRAALLEEEQKKTMKELHKAMASKLKERKKKVKDFEKMEKAAAMAAQRLHYDRGCGRGRGEGRGRGRGDTAAADEPQPGRGRGRGRVGARGQGRGRGRGQGKGKGRRRDAGSDSDSPEQPASDSDSHERSPPSSRSPSPAATRANLIPSSSQGPGIEQHSTPSSRSPSLAPAPAPGPSPEGNTAVEEDENEPDDGEETGITLINGHRWVKNRRNVEFQVLWTDKDVTWEPLDNVDDCAAMDTYLALHDLTDPLLLRKRKYMIDPGLESSN
ncbi:DDE superfamily endonuclease-domain-containing protein [Mycena floridula]|nr:DDE superfamily endonuclease-domain-containing protein [Mycena floridula]